MEHVRRFSNLQSVSLEANLNLSWEGLDRDWISCLFYGVRMSFVLCLLQVPGPVTGYIPHGPVVCEVFINNLFTYPGTVSVDT